MSEPLLCARGVTKIFGGLTAVNAVDLSIAPKQILSVIGPNGAGKTTFFNCLTGIYRPEAGEVTLAGQNVVGLPPHRICKLGMARTFQNIRLFGEMTALENVMVGQTLHRNFSPGRLLLRTGNFQREEKRFRDEALDLLEFVELSAIAETWARGLAYGVQRRLEIARALATRPKLILLDEPAAGMNPKETDDMIALIGRLRERGLAVILIEHHMKLVMQISDEIVVLDHGERIAAGTPCEVRANPRVIAAYLGQEAVEEHA